MPPVPKTMRIDPRRLLSLYQWIAAYNQEHGYSPSKADVVNLWQAPDGFRMASTSVVSYYYGHMTRAGLLTVTPGISRGIRLLPVPKQFRRVAEKE